MLVEDERFRALEEEFERLRHRLASLERPLAEAERLNALLRSEPENAAALL